MHQFISGLLFPLTSILTLTPPERQRDDRGDVPGWVMVTLMTAIVVAALTPFVSDRLMSLLRQAFSMVSS